jgi:hypothetical protein
MAQATYFIEVDTYWQNSRSYFVGPFESRDAAEAWYQNDDWTAEDNTWLSTSNCGGDIRSAWRIYPKALSRTAARKQGLRQFSAGDDRDNVIDPSTKPQARALSQAARFCDEVYA